MKNKISLSIFLVTFVLSIGCKTTHEPWEKYSPKRRAPNTIVSINHNGLLFNVSLSERNDEASVLEVSFPKKVDLFPIDGSLGTLQTLKPRNVKIRVKLMDLDTVFEGGDHTPGGVVNAGSGKDSYRLSLARGVAIGHIHSVIVWIGTEKYEFSSF